MKVYYGYEAFKNDTNILKAQVAAFSPEVIVAIARGGLTLAHALAEGLGLRDVQSLRTELYDGSVRRSEIALFGSCDFREKQRVLVVDDIADSGETLKAVMEYLEQNYRGVEFQAATLFYKRSSSYEPHFWVNEAHTWIEFFWEADF